MHNLDIAFPEKSLQEKKKIARKFYHNLIDTFIETIKMISAGNGLYKKRFKGNWELVNQFKDSGRSVQLHLGHNFNWEWGNAVASMGITMPFIAVYMPIVNPIFERLFYKLRSRAGTILVRATHMRNDFLPYRNQQYALALAADQNPGEVGRAWWFNFFGRPTPFVKGPAKNAIASNTAVVFVFLRKIKRGYYEAVLSLAEADPRQTTEKELTRKFVIYLEGLIREYPDMWLWSHRRWKHEWKPEYGPVE
jgi:KDO2-lipid IV(A) lauroyltransferase